MVIYEILDSILIVAIMASCATSAHQSPEWKVFTAADRDERAFQELCLVLYFMCASTDSYESLSEAVKMWFTGKDFKDKYYGKKFFEEMETMCIGSPGKWYRPSRICKNIKLLKSVNLWERKKMAEHGLQIIYVRTDEEIERAKELIPTLPDELKPLSIVRRIRNLSGWIKMDSSDMHKEVVYFMTHLMRTAWGAESMDRVRKVYELDQYMPWTVAVGRICNSMSVQDEMGFFNYCVKLYKKKLMRRFKNAPVRGSTVSIVDSIMGSTESVI